MTECLRRNVLPHFDKLSDHLEPQGKSDAMPAAQCPDGRNAFGAMSFGRNGFAEMS
jgi:hypothetical protein